MSNITIRQIQHDEATSISRMFTTYAFRATPPLPSMEEYIKRSAHRDEAAYFAAFHDETPIAISASSPLIQNIRGAFFSGGGLWAVTTHPAGRRKGVARDMLRQFFEYLYKEGNAVALLYPFRESFYAQLGFTTFTQPRRVRFSPTALQPLLKKDLGGEVELVEIAHGFETYQAFLHQRQRSTHGMAIFSPKRSSGLRDQNDYWLAIARANGEVKGTMLYKILDYKGTMQVDHFWYEDSQGRYLLLEWFARHIDQIGEVEILLSPAERPETWWNDLSLNISSTLTPMGRVINMTKLNGMQTGRGRFTAHISDEYCPWNTGNYLFESVDNCLQISPCEATECELSIHAVSALIYGTHEPESFAIRGWGNPSPTLQATMQHMFPLQQPYLYEDF
jgi:predicted acetyltransferase